MIYLDTHVVVWLFTGHADRLSKKARKLIEEDSELMISPMVVLELEYLHEIERLAVGGREIAHGLATQIGLQICPLPFPTVIDAAIDQSWTRDPFDRLIVAQAVAATSPLLTKDATIRRHCKLARW